MYIANLAVVWRFGAVLATFLFIFKFIKIIILFINVKFLSMYVDVHGLLTMDVKIAMYSR